MTARIVSIVGGLAVVAAISTAVLAQEKFEEPDLASVSIRSADDGTCIVIAGYELAAADTDIVEVGGVPRLHLTAEVPCARLSALASRLPPGDTLGGKISLSLVAASIVRDASGGTPVCHASLRRRQVPADEDVRRVYRELPPQDVTAPIACAALAASLVGAEVIDAGAWPEDALDLPLPRRGAVQR